MSRRATMTANAREVSAARRNRRKQNAARALYFVRLYGTCCICDRPIDEETYTIEHIVPLCKFEDKRVFRPENIEASCDPCNTGKKNKTVAEMCHGQFYGQMYRWLRYRIVGHQDFPSEAEMVDWLRGHSITGRIVVPHYLDLFREEKARLTALVPIHGAD